MGAERNINKRRAPADKTFNQRVLITKKSDDNGEGTPNHATLLITAKLQQIDGLIEEP